ncbi:cyclic AMP-dependent transcription factor ATF-4 [Chanos chanos]|uniref:Cyclic AMP-dependent transcription factor ATF-4 n=1 Tax=Chanos chanos TaxID=29144 RepID=A0A6J2VZE0_CHACN|nr:cyclic AMP-dependent transcription factor ATF-4 [Chanos chanos]
MALSSQLALEDMGTLFLGSSYLMADPFGPLLDEDDQPLSEGPPSPLSSSYAESSISSPSPPPSPSSLLGCKAGSDLLSLPWLSADELFNAHAEADISKEDAFTGMDWMTEKIDLSDFDLDSIIGSCDSDEPPSSPEELLASLDSQMDLDLDPLPFPDTPAQGELGIPIPELPTLPVKLPPQESQSEPEIRPEPVSVEVEIKSEPPSPAPLPIPPLSPAFTLELGSEVDVSELEKVVSKPLDELQASSIVLSLPQAHIVVLLTPKEESSTVLNTSTDQSDSDSGISSTTSSPVHQPSPAPSPEPVSSSRTKPYSKPDPDAVPAVSGKVKSVSGAPKLIEKKLKKMEQNKTAATRYRQKKRAEQETLNAECSELEKRNRELAEKADSISREIQYLKDLLEEVRSAKNRKSKSSSV